MDTLVALSSATRWQHTPILSSGFALLDEHLPSGGWPLGVLIELLMDDWGCGELSLLLPALRQVAAGWSHWINPPLKPYAPALAAAALPLERVLTIDAPALKDQLWAMEQAIGSPAATSVLAWCGAVEERWLRRLQLAAHRTSCLCVVWRPQRFQTQRSPAALRVVLDSTPCGLSVRTLKARALIKKDTVLLPWETLWAHSAAWSPRANAG